MSKLVMMQKEINEMRFAFGRCAVSSHKQIGLRCLRDAEAFLGRNSDLSEQLLGKAKYHLPYAECWRR